MNSPIVAGAGGDQTLERVLASRVRAFREAAGWSQDELARRIRELRFSGWSRAVVAAFEAGRRRAGIADLVALSLALGRPVPDLLSTHAWVMLEPDGVRVRGEALRRLLGGEHPGNIKDGDFRAGTEAAALRWDGTTARELERLILDSVRDSRGAGVELGPGSGKTHAMLILVDAAARGELERYVARRLEADPFLVALVSYRLWGTSATAERERRAKDRPGAKQHVSREVVRELADFLVRLPDGAMAVVDVKTDRRGRGSEGGSRGKRRPVGGERPSGRGSPDSAGASTTRRGQGGSR